MWGFVILSRMEKKKFWSYEGNESTVFVVNGNNDWYVFSLIWANGSNASAVNLILSSKSIVSFDRTWET